MNGFTSRAFAHGATTVMGLLSFRFIHKAEQRLFTKKTVHHAMGWQNVFLPILMCFLLSAASYMEGAGAGTVLRVDAASTAIAPDGVSWDTAYTAIQAAVDAASAAGGGEVWVKAGIYTGMGNPVLTMRGKVHIYGGFTGTEHSREERDWVANVTVVDGAFQYQCVVGASNATLDGFTIQHGSATDGGGMYNHSASLAVANCIFRENSADDCGGGMYNSISSFPAVTNCIFRENSADDSGGGMFNSISSSPVVTNCTFAGNSASSGSGMSNAINSSPAVTNCIFTGNSAYYGVGMSNYNNSSPVVMNCTFHGNSADYNYGGMYNSSSSPIVTNCIFWGNTRGEICNSSSSTPSVTYSCIQGGYYGEGNTDENPLFWDTVNEDFRPHLSSPCVDSGTSAGAPASDSRGILRPQGAGVDMGAYELDPTGGERDSDGDGLEDAFEITYSGTDPLNADSNGDGVNDWEEWFRYLVWYVNAAVPVSETDGTSWATAFPVLQTAVDAAFLRGGGDVWVAAGTYAGTEDNVLILRENVNVYGGFNGTESIRDARDWAVNATIIDGGSVRRCVRGVSNAVLDGFIVQHGNAASGGGMYNASASPVLMNCAFSLNSASSGGGMCNISSSPSITNCAFFGNSATSGAGIYNYYNSFPSVINCTFSGNSADHDGGGIYNDSSSPVVMNCILWGDTGEEIYNNSSVYTSSSPSTPSVTFSCILGGYEGEGNTGENPLLWDSLQGDFRLHPASPCVDSGTSAGAPTFDIRGIARPQGIGVDMGAYEKNPTGGEADSDGDGLADAFEVSYSGTDPLDADTDGDGVNDGEDWFRFRVWYVNAAVSVSEPDGRSWETAFPAIQTAVDAAFLRGGGGVWVAAGTYTGSDDNVLTMRDRVNIYGGFNGTEHVRDARDWETNPTVIDGESVRRCVLGTSNARLDGFTVQHGNAFYGGGMCNPSTSPVVTNCIFSGNTSSFGGGMCNGSFASPVVTYCTFSGNSTSETEGRGGGMYSDEYSAPVVTHCEFSGNSASDMGGGMCNDGGALAVVSNCIFTGNHTTGANSWGGGGMFNCGSSSLRVTNCTFSGNSTTESSGGGGGMRNFYCSPAVKNCMFFENSASNGGGMYNTSSSPTLMNCVFFMNSALYLGGGISNSYYSSSPTATNCILWGNIGGEIYDDPSASMKTTVFYSCVEGGFEGEGNTAENPLFWDAPNRDFRLHPFSPCVDSGTSAGAPASDIRGVARPQGAGVDMGAYEMNSTDGEADSDGDGLADAFEIEYSGTDPLDADTDGDGVSDGDDWFRYRTWYVNAAALVSDADGKSWEKAFPTIQQAVDMAYFRGGGDVWVAAGTYTGVGGNAVILRYNVNLYGGFNGTEAVLNARNLATNTSIIDGESVRRCVLGANNATLNGFVIRNGSAFCGGGMFNSYVSPTVTNCSFAENKATVTYASGGGMCNRSASPTVMNCMFARNRAGFGGGMFNVSASPVVSNCIFTGNSAFFDGGGMDNSFDCSPSVMNCTFSENTAFEGGGMNNFFDCSPSVMNCTFFGNSADTGGGMHNWESSPVLTNCILWSDISMEIVSSSWPSRAVVTYSCVQGGYNGDGNISENPLFRISSSGDFRLQQSSPCVNSGTSTDAPDTDIRGVSRPQGSGVDMGAYEYIPSDELSTHSADTSGDWKLQLPELLRVVQFFNMGGYSCDTTGMTLDGYTAGAGASHDCQRHGSDFDAPAWEISLAELIRLIQIFNMGSYHVCPGGDTEDGYCPGMGK